MTGLSRVIAMSAGVAVLGLGATLRAQSFTDVQTHLDEQATVLRAQVGELASELRGKSRRSADYRRLYRDSTEMFFLADHIHDLMHGPLNLAHIAADVEDLDRAFHRIEEFAGDVEGHHQDSRYHHDDDAPSGLSERLAAIDEVLHHLRDDVKQLRTLQARTPVERSRPGVSIGNRRFRIQFGD